MELHELVEHAVHKEATVGRLWRLGHYLEARVVGASIQHCVVDPRRVVALQRIVAYKYMATQQKCGLLATIVVVMCVCVRVVVPEITVASAVMMLMGDCWLPVEHNAYSALLMLPQYWAAPAPE